MKKGIIVFDMDGTISNLNHRLRFITDRNPKDWDSFFDSVGGDSLNEWSLQLAQALNLDGWDIVISSGRPERTRQATEQWLNKHSFPFKELHLVRSDGDHAADDLLKEQWLKTYPRANDIAFVIDDRQRVVDMWRRNGLVCLQCYAWKEPSEK